MSSSLVTDEVVREVFYACLGKKRKNDDDFLVFFGVPPRVVTALHKLLLHETPVLSILCFLNFCKQKPCIEAMAHFFDIGKHAVRKSIWSTAAKIKELPLVRALCLLFLGN